MEQPANGNGRASWRRVLSHWPFGVVALITVIGYQAVQGRYYFHYMDDAWVMSWVWHYMQDGTVTDGVYRDGTPVLLFGKTMWLVYGGLLELLGWSKDNALEVSTLLIYATGVLWYHIGRRVGWDAQTSLILAFGIVLLDKVVEAGVLCRSEAFVLLVISGALLAFMHRRYLLAGMLALGGFEAHPMALTALFYILAWTIAERHYFLEDKRRTLRQMAWFCGGALLGLAWYFWLHWDSLSLDYVADVASRSNKFGDGKRAEWTYLDRHFRYYSQPELVVFVIALFAYVQKKQWRENLFPLAAVVCVVFSALLNRRPNGFYAALAFPALATLTVCAFRRAAILKAAFAVLIVTFMIQSYTRWSDYRHITPAESRAQLVKLVPDDGLPVAGMNDFWFIFRERPFLPADYSSSVSKRLGEPAWSQVYLLDSSYKSNRRPFSRIKKHLKRHFIGQEIARFKEHGRHVLKVMRYSRKPPKKAPE